jgi:predicted metal-binding membrane protein
MREAAMTDGLLERVLKRDRRIVVAALALLAALAWGYVLIGAGTGMSPRAMTTVAFPPFAGRPMGTVAPEPWSPGYAILMLLMWWVMMIAMMTPSAAPMMLLHADITRRGGGAKPAAATAAFVAGYLAIWLWFSLAAAGLEWALERLALVSPMLMWSESETLTGAFLILAGAYQLTPVKAACLAGCRSPLGFLAQHWRAGAGGAFRMGLWHGLYCIGCCWALMLLLFAGGVMNLLWIAGLTLVVILEKLLPGGRVIGWALGGGLLLLGIALLAWPQRFL